MRHVRSQPVGTKLESCALFYAKYASSTRSLNAQHSDASTRTAKMCAFNTWEASVVLPSSSSLGPTPSPTPLSAPNDDTARVLSLSLCHMLIVPRFHPLTLPAKTPNCVHKCCRKAIVEACVDSSVQGALPQSPRCAFII